MTLPDLPPPHGAPENDDERAHWRIEDERSAEWVMRKLARFRRREAELVQLRLEYQEQLDDWWRENFGPLEKDMSWATGALSAWAARRREEDPEAKSISLPSGRVSTRWVGERARAVDPATVAESFARARHPEAERLIRSRIEIDANLLNSLVRVADEWVLTLSCGCSCGVWQLSAAEVATEGQHWPRRPGEHRKDCEAPESVVTSVERARVGQPVTIIDTDRGPRVYALSGVAIAPGHLSVTVTPK